MAIDLNTLRIEAALAEKYGYKPLDKELSKDFRRLYTENIPSFLNVSGSIDTLYTMNGSKVCNGYDRIVIGDYGAFIEFSQEHMASKFVIKQGQEYRINDEKYKNNVKYVWLTINDRSDIKIYYQKKKVSYADYKPNKYYVSVHEVINEPTWGYFKGDL